MNAIGDILSSKKDDFFNGTVRGNEPGLQIQSSTSSQLKQMIYGMKDHLDSMLRILNGESANSTPIIGVSANELLSTGEQIIEGVFNGEKMVGPDGKEYNIPPNYASKSKLVEGDMMKLTITKNGQFIYKQIAPIERKRLKGELVSNPDTGQWSVLGEGKTYKVLMASVTFWRGSAGDEVIFLVPENGESSWGAVENIIHRS